MKDIFNFDEQRIKEQVNREYGLLSKVKTCFKYLEGKLPQNRITKTLRNLKCREGKSYDFYMFKDKDVSILVREYRYHFTIYVYYRPVGERAYFDKCLTIFTIYDDTDKMSEDQWSEDNKRTLKQVLSQLPLLTREGKLHSVWNSLCLIVPDYTKVELIANRETVYNLDKLLFALDEVAQIHLELFSENEVLEKLKTLKVGDKFGEVEEITEIRTDVKNDYYHAVGLSTKRIDEWGMKNEKKDEWKDVYSLTRWYYDELFNSPLTN